MGVDGADADGVDADADDAGAGAGADVVGDVDGDVVRLAAEGEDTRSFYPEHVAGEEGPDEMEVGVEEDQAAHH